MNLWPVAFVGASLSLFAMPLVPALLEWRNKRDAAPLGVVRGNDGNIRFFAVRFREFVHARFPELGGQAPVARTGRLENGESFEMAGLAGLQPFGPDESAQRLVRRLLLGAGDLVLPGDMLYEKEIFAAGAVACGARSTLRAVLAEGELKLEDDCEVLRWIHSGAQLACGDRCRLPGRASADASIRLGIGSRFVRLHAPVLYFGTSTADAIPAPGPLQVLEIDAQYHTPGTRRWLLDGALRVPAGCRHDGDLITGGRLDIGRGSQILGSIKSNARLCLESGTRIDGAVAASGEMFIGAHCSVRGPVVAEDRVVIARGTVVGTPEAPTTVTATVVQIEEGAVVHGTIWARDHGDVVPADAMTNEDHHVA